QFTLARRAVRGDTDEDHAAAGEVAELDRIAVEGTGVEERRPATGIERLGVPARPEALPYLLGGVQVPDDPQRQQEVEQQDRPPGQYGDGHERHGVSTGNGRLR